MTVKNQLLTLFEKNKGQFFSGEELAETLSVSRNAVWKAVKSLKADGYEITSDSKKGYALSSGTDILSESGIRNYLKKKDVMLDVHTSIDSTNAYAKTLAEQGHAEDTIVVAAEQTKGRGRRGRDFYSPSQTGVYLSFLLRPKHCSSEDAAHITTMAAVAVAEAITEVSGERTDIKWVNDIYMNGKKVCGILTEAAFNLEDTTIDYAILGIGINLYAPESGFPTEIKDIAGCVFTAPLEDAKNHIVAEVIDRFYSYYKDFGTWNYVSAYKERCFVIGKEIYILSGNTKTEATAIDLDKDCHLIVSYKDGTTEALSSGEISIRIKS